MSALQVRPREVVTTDVVVVGAGPVGLFTAALARRAGLEVVLVESDDLLGGSAAAGDGTLWLPGGEGDESGPAGTYLTGLGMEPDEAAAFTTLAPKVVQALTGLGVETEVVAGEPDSHPEDAGGARSGRVREPKAASARELRRHAREVRFHEGGGTLAERRLMVVASRNPRGVTSAVGVLGVRGMLARLAGSQPVVGGSALVAGPAAAVFASGVTVWRNTRALRLVAGDVPTLVVLHDEAEVDLAARRGVVVTSGGFSHNPELRRRHLPAGADVAWSLAAPGTDGAMMLACESLGAASGGFGDAEWRPSLVRSGGEIRPIDLERCLPYSFLVDRAGSRFTNEAGNGVEVGRAMLARTAEVSAVPSFLVFDRRHRRRYPLGGWPPMVEPVRAVRRGDLAIGQSLIDLAGALGIDKAGLVSAGAAFNRGAKKGKDDDFGRGASAADRAHGSPFHRPNTSLGPVERPPLMGVRVYPAEVSTRGGLVTDETARVLTPAGDAVPGLWAAGAVAALTWGSREPGPGAALGFALCRGFAAVEAMASVAAS